MKILLVTDYFPPDKVGGVGVIASELKRAYEALGHEVIVLTTGRRRRSEIRRNIFRSSTRLSWGVLLNNLHSLKLIRREDIDLVHMHQASSTFFLVARTFCRNFPFVLDSLQVSYLSEAREISAFSVGDRVFRPRAREYVEKYLKAPVHVAFDWLGYKLSDRVTVVSEQNRDEFVAGYGTPPSKKLPAVVPNGVRPMASSVEFRDQDLEQKTADRVVVSYVGVFRTRKRVQNLLLALERVVEDFPEVILLLIGTGRGLGATLRSLSRELGIEDHVEFVGQIPHARVGYYLELTDVFCLLSSYEGMPMALLEAMRAGKAVVATDCYGMRELISDGENGRLVPVDDIPQTAKALKELVASPQKRRVLGRAAQRRARTRLEWDRVAQRYLNLVDSSETAHR